MLSRHTLLGVWAFRLVNALIAATYFCPDEYWQGPEIAHRLVFGYGYLTWEWKEGIRSILHPMLLSLPYYVLQATNLDQTSLLWLFPRILMATLAVVGDWGTQRLARRLFSSSIASYTLILSLASWFNLYASTRTLSNTAEWALTAAALALWPWEGTSSSFASQFKRMIPPLAIAATAVLLRPTNAVIWFFLSLQYIASSPLPRAPPTLLAALLVGTFALSLLIGTDYLFYGHLTFTPYTFIHANIVRGVSLFYGSHPWYWYLTEGWTVLLTTYIPLLVLGLRGAPHRLPLAIVLLVTAVYSVLSHKEHRFLYPLLPFVLPYVGRGMAVALTRYGRWTAYALIGLAIVPNLLMGLYFTAIHQRGVVDVVHWLRSQGDRVTSIGYLMPCHSTPYYSEIHRPIPMWFLTCEPPTSSVDVDYEDEADIFYRDPTSLLSSLQLTPPSKADPWMETRRRWWPSHLVMFSPLLPTVLPYLEGSPYRECASFFNSHFHDDSRREGRVHVYCKTE